VDLEGNVREGTFQQLESVLGAGSFNEGNEATRWEHFLNSGLAMADEFKDAHRFCKEREDQLWERRDEIFNALRLPEAAAKVAQQKRAKAFLNSPMQVPIGSLGCVTGGAQVENGKLAKAVAHTYYDLLAIDLKSRALDLDTDDQRRMAYMAAGRSRTARVLVSGPMERSIRFTNLEFTTAMQCYLGLRCELTSGIVGESIPTNESRRDYRVDLWGRTLQTAHGWSGDTRHFRAHMELEHAIANDIRSVGSGSMSCSQEVVNLFLPQIPDCDGRSMIAGLSESEGHEGGQRRHNSGPRCPLRSSPPGGRAGGARRHGHSLRHQVPWPGRLLHEFGLYQARGGNREPRQQSAHRVYASRGPN